MTSVRQRQWRKNGSTQTAFVVDYIDADRRRRLQTFASVEAAEAFKSAIDAALTASTTSQVVEQLPTPKPPSVPKAAAPSSLAHDIVWGAAAIGAVLNITARQAFFLLDSGFLPAKKIGKRWVASRKAILDALTP